MHRFFKPRVLLGLLASVCLLIFIYTSFVVADVHMPPTDSFIPSTSPALNEYLASHPEYSLSDVDNGLSTFDGIRYVYSGLSLYETNYEMTFEYELYSGMEGYLIVSAEHLSKDNQMETEELLYDFLPAYGNEETLHEWYHPYADGTLRIEIELYRDAIFTPGSLSIRSAEPYFADAILKTLFAALVMGILCFVCTYAKSQNERMKTYVMFGLCFLFAVVSGLPLLTSGLADTHDLPFHLSRIKGLSMLLKEGIFSTQINPYGYQSYGYCDPAFYPYTFLFLPAFLHTLNISLLLSYKALVFFASFATAAIAGFVGLRLTKSRKAGLLLSIAYTFATYRLTNIYVRGAVGEMLAMAFIPLVFYGLHSILNDSKKSWLSLSLGMCCIIQSHVLSVVLSLFFLVLYGLLNLRKCFQKEVLLALFKAILLCVGLCAWWVVPFLGWSSYGIANSHTAIFANAAQPSQLFHQFVFYPKMTSDAWQLGTQHEMPLTVGIWPLLGVLLYACIRFYFQDALSSQKSLRSFCDFGAVAFVLSLFLSSTLVPYLTLVNDLPFSFLNTIQMPWRFLAYASFFGASLLALSLWMLLKNENKSKSAWIFIIIALLNVFCSLPLMETVITIDETDYLTSSSPMEIYADELYLPIAFSSIQSNGNPPFYVCADESVSFSDDVRKALRRTFTFSNPSGNAQTFTLPLYAYPNCFATLDESTALVISMDESYGYLQVSLPEGITAGTITAGFETLPYSFIGYGLTLASVFFCFIGWIVSFLPKHRKI